METPAPKVGSPMLIGVGPEIETREVPEAVARMTTGCVWTWGSGECDQLAVRSDLVNDENHRETPIIIKALSTPICDSVAAGSMHNLAIINKGREVLSWGCNDEGTLGRPIKYQDTSHIWKNAVAPPGDQTLMGPKAPGLVWNLPHDTPIRQVSAGGSHSAAITQSGDCYCWGCYRDQTGNIGFADYKTGAGSTSWYLIDPAEPRLGQPLPTLVPGLEGVCIELISGENHTGVLTALKDGSRRIFLWGAAEFGQLGIEPPDLFEEKRTASLFPIAWSVDKFEFKWPEGQQDGGFKLQPHPNENDLKNATLLHLYGGKYATFFSVDMKGSIETFGFGKNACGELGAGFEQDIVVHPVPLKSVKGLAWSDIKGGEFFTIGLTCDGSVFTWGHKEYVGLGSTVAKGSKHVLEPRLVPGLKQRVAAIEASHRTAFALTEDGQLFAWGESSNYQIGDGNYYEDPVTKPLRVHPRLFDFGFVFGMAGGAQHTLALVKPCPEELKTLESSRMVVAAEANPNDDAGVEQRGRKRAREDGDDAADLTERKKARHKEHQVNTDQLPSLTNPLVNTGPPSTTLQVPPPTPTESNELKKLSTLSDLELPPITEAPENNTLQCDSDIDGSDTPIRKPRDRALSAELDAATGEGAQKARDGHDQMDDGEPNAAEHEDDDGHNDTAEPSDDERDAASNASGEEDADDEDDQVENDSESEAEEPAEAEAMAEALVSTQSQASQSQDKVTRGRKIREKPTPAQVEEKAEAPELRRTRAASRVSAKKPPASRVTRGTAGRVSATKAEKPTKATKPEKSEKSKAEIAKERIRSVVTKTKSEPEKKESRKAPDDSDKKREALTRKTRSEKKEDPPKKETKNEKKRSLSKAIPEEPAAPSKRSRSRKVEADAETVKPEASEGKRVTRGKKVESEPPPPPATSREEARAAPTKSGKAAAAPRTRRGSKSKVVEEEASQESIEAASEPEAEVTRVTRRKAEPKKAEAKAKAKAKATAGSTRRKDRR